MLSRFKLFRLCWEWNAVQYPEDSFWKNFKWAVKWYKADISMPSIKEAINYRKQRIEDWKEYGR